jgi:hypothetical protein
MAPTTERPSNRSANRAPHAPLEQEKPMSATSFEEPIRARIPADLDTPDRLVAGLSAHQLAILTAAAVPLYALWQILGERVPVPALAVLTAVIGALAVVVALGRRDGLSLDRWLIAAITHRLRPRRLAPAGGQHPPVLPAWAPASTGPDHHRPPGVLRLPAQAIAEDGAITTGPGTSLALVAASTVTAGLHTPGEQGALLAGYARWLNSLTGRVQIVVSARRLDLGARALQLAENAHRLAHPALATAAIEHAEHLLDLCQERDPLTRTVTIACTANTAATSPRGRGAERAGREQPGARGEAARRAGRTAAALAALGSRCRVLSGPEVCALLAAAVDPWGPAPEHEPRTPPGVPVTAQPTLMADHEGSPTPSPWDVDERGQAGDDGDWDESGDWGLDDDSAQGRWSR